MAPPPATPVSIRELERAKTLVSAHFLSQSAYSVRPIGILLGGQPASGKTGLIRYLQRIYTNKTFIVINGDELRSYHPRYKAIVEHYSLDAPKYTQPFSNKLVEWLKTECIRLRHNFIIEGTMRTLSVIELTAQSVKQAGFICQGHVLAISREDSLLGIFQRYEGEFTNTGSGRFSKIETHDEAYQQIPINLQTAINKRWFDRLMIYKRESPRKLTLKSINNTYTAIIPSKLKLLHDMGKNLFGPPINIEALFIEARQPIFDKPFYYQRWLEVAQLARQRGETNADYLEQIDGFIRAFAA